MSVTRHEETAKTKIEVIGPGCPFCRRRHKTVLEVVEEQGMEADVAHVTDFKTVLRYVPFTPVLTVDGQIVHRGKFLPDKDKLLKLIRTGAEREER